MFKHSANLGQNLDQCLRFNVYVNVSTEFIPRYRA